MFYRDLTYKNYIHCLVFRFKVQDIKFKGLLANQALLLVGGQVNLRNNYKTAQSPLIETT